MQKLNLIIRPLEQRDIPEITDAFQELGWDKPGTQYERYLAEQNSNLRDVCVALVDEKFAGYLTIAWASTYPPFRTAGTPEIMDFNVLPEFRRQGIGTALMDKAENEIAKVSLIAGIGVGLDSDYGAAQRLYILRGYIPDGRGVYHRGHYPTYGEHIIIDDDLAIFLTKELK
ncbi:MAG: GNAT family N-acetyltransferase [Chloroflexota bacterium]